MLAQREDRRHTNTLMGVRTANMAGAASSLFDTFDCRTDLDPPCPRPMSAQQVRALVPEALHSAHRMLPLAPDHTQAEFTRDLLWTRVAGLPIEGYCVLCNVNKLLLVAEWVADGVQTEEEHRWLVNDAADCFPIPRAICYCFLQGGVMMD